MKKLILKSAIIALPLLTSFGSNAQISKGTKFIGGMLNLSTSSQENSGYGNKYEFSQYNAGIAPRFGCYISNSFAIGVGLHYNVTSATTSQFINYGNYSEMKATHHSFGASVFGRYNWALSKKFGFFMDGNVGYTRTNEKMNVIGNYVILPYPYDNNLPVVPGNSFSMAVVPGIIFFPSDQIGIEATYGNLRYQFANSDNNGMMGMSSKSSNLGLNLGLSTIQFGFNYYFKCKPKVKADDVDME